MATIDFVYNVEGTPTDVDSAKLSEPGGTYGVRRTDTNATVVADGTNMTHSATGTYTYDLGEIAVEHEYYIEIIEDLDNPEIVDFIHGFVQPPGSGGGSGPTVESDLSVTRTQLQIEVANYLGLNTASSSWGTKNSDRISRIVKNGERMFYRPSRLPNEQSIHTWSFLNQIGEFALDAGDTEFNLPADYAAFMEPRLHYLGEDEAWHDVKEVGVGRILKRRQNTLLSSATNYPDVYAVAPRAVDQTTGQRFQLMVDPAPTAACTLTGFYKVNPFAISASDPYPLGGQPHAETIRAACLAAAEMDRYGSRGDLYARFMEQLADSVALDRKQSAPKSFGYNGDRSGCYERDLPWERHRVGTVTFPWS